MEIKIIIYELFTIINFHYSQLYLYSILKNVTQQLWRNTASPQRN